MTEKVGPIKQTWIKEVIVVEGQKDTAAVRRAVEADTIETRGSAVGPEVIAQVERAARSRGAIILTDPDGAGERIRRIVSQAVPGCKHAFVSREEAVGERGVGVEYASPEAIRQALQSARWEEAPPYHMRISREMYMKAGLVGRPDSRQLREQLAEILGIGYGNAKQFFRRLHLLHITREEFEQALARVGKDVGDD